LLELIAVFSQ